MFILVTTKKIVSFKNIVKTLSINEVNIKNLLLKKFSSD
jgi:hypothetical protein